MSHVMQWSVKYNLTFSDPLSAVNQQIDFSFVFFLNFPFFVVVLSALVLFVFPSVYVVVAYAIENKKA